MESRKPFVLAFTAVIWLAVVAGFYYHVHKPVTPEVARGLALAVGRILVAGGVISFAGGIGEWVLPWPQASPMVRMVSQTAVGVGILALLIFLMGVTVGYSPLTLGIMLLVIVLVFRKHIFHWWQTWAGLRALLNSGGRLGRAIYLGVGLILIFTLFISLSPPLKFDTLVYHLALPQAYLENGRIAYFPWIMFWGMPQLTEMLYLFAMSLGGGEAAVLVGWIIGFLTIVGLFSYISERINPRAGWVAVACLLAGFTFAASLSWGYVDWLAMLFGLTILIFLDEWSRTEEPRFLFFAALIAGFVIGTKYTAGIIALGGALVLLLQSRPHPWQKILKNFAIFCIVTMIVASPWLLKNWFATGNPLYPLIFPAGAMTELRLIGYQNQAPGWNWIEVLFLPWQATMNGVEGGDGYAATIGPLLLGLGVFAGINLRHAPKDRQKTIQNAMIIGLVGLLFWAMVARLFSYSQQARLYFVIFPALVILAGAGYANLEQIKLPGVRLYRVVGVLILLIFGLNVLQVTEYTFRKGAPQLLLGLTSPADYLTENLGMTALAMQTVNELSSDARVLMLWEPRSYYCAPRCFPDEILDRWRVDRQQFRTSAQILLSWRAAGYTHLLVYHTGADFYRHDPPHQLSDWHYQPEDWQTLDELLGSLPVQTDLNQIYTLYSLIP